jgi:hypothetical protein
VFAAGVILYILLCGYPPFNAKSVRQLFVRTVKGKALSAGFCHFQQCKRLQAVSQSDSAFFVAFWHAC